MPKPDVFDYLNYRDFLKDFYVYKKSEDKRFSYQKFAELANIKAKSHLKMIIDGSRNITNKFQHKIAGACELSGNEAKYFFVLVQFNHESDLEKKTAYFKELHSLARVVKREEITGDLNMFLSKWYYAAVKSYLNVKRFNPEPNEISKKLRNFITPGEAFEAIDLLMKLGLVKKVNFGYEIVERHLGTNEKTIPSYVKNFHEQMLNVSKKALDEISKEDRIFRAMTIDTSVKGIELIKEMIKKFYQDLANITEKEGSSEAVCQVNFQFLKLSID